MHTRSPLRAWPMLLVTAALLATALPGAAAHRAEVFEHGRLFLDFETPEGGCTVTVEGRHIDVKEGTLQFFVAPIGPSGPTLVNETAVEGEPETQGGGWRFLQGPFSRDDFGGASPDFVTLTIEADGQDHFLTRVFDFDACRNVDLVTAFDPPTGGRPTCTFQVEGENLLSPEGFLQIRDSEQNEVERIDVDARPEENGEGWQFLSRRITLDKDDRYSVRFVYTGGDTGNRDSTISDSFVLDECGPDRVPPTFCSFALDATAEDDGAIRLAWIVPQFAQGANIYRATGSDDLALIATIPTKAGSAADFRDDTTQAGTSYRYQIVAFNDAGEATDEGCPVIEVTAIPFFGAPLVALLASLGAVGAYAWSARRR